MNTLHKLYFVSALFATVLATGLVSYAADGAPTAGDRTASPTKPAAAQAKPKRDWYPFGGIVASVNKQANTISLQKKQGERVLNLDAKSTLEIGGKPGAIGGVNVGDYAHGKLHKDSAGNEVITSAKFDKEPPKKHSQKAVASPEQK